MNRRPTTLIALFVGLLLSSLASGQTPAKQKPPEQKPVREATAVAVEPTVPLHVTVTGLTKDNVAKVKDALTALSIQSFVCKTCKVEQTSAGSCPKCKAALEPMKQALLASVAPSAEQGGIDLKLDPRHPTRVSEIETALASSAVKIDYAKMPLPGALVLVVDGTADQLSAVEAALTAAKTFEEVHATFDAASGKIHVHARSGAAPPMRAAVTATLGAAKFQLSDVILGRAPKG